MSKVIFTIGHSPLLPFPTFVQLLKKYGVNCVVDVREEQEGGQYGEYDQTVLRENLMLHKTWYLSFLDEFGRMNDARKNNQKAQYETIIETDNFKKGIERLERGIEKGCTIALLGKERNPVMCHRSRIICRYLSRNGWEVKHILPNGEHISQDTIEAQILRTEEEHRSRRTATSQIGMTGEEIAAQYLMTHGYRILDHNWNLHKGCELDIIAFKDNTLHAIEVKTRQDDAVMTPEQAINEEKLSNILKAFHFYRSQKHLLNLPAQVDSIAIVYHNEEDYSIQMYEDVNRRTKRFYH